MGAGRAELRVEGQIAVIRFSNPPTGLMDEAMERGLLEAVEAVEADASIRACVLTGGEPDVFIRHYDVAVLSRRSGIMRERGMTFAEGDPAPEGRIHAAMRRMEGGRTAYIAALNGTAMGGGFELALACDLRLVQDGPHRFGLPEINLGILPGAGGTQRLPRLIGEAKALEMMLLGDTWAPRELAEVGLARVCVEGDVLEPALDLARRLAAKPPRALRHIKRLARMAHASPKEDALMAERALFCDLMVSEDAGRLMAEAARGQRIITDEPGQTR